MIILGIETSCDETAAAICQNNLILSSSVASSVKIQKQYGGIIPEQAAREQIKFITPVIEKTISEAKISPKDISAISVTQGPGLIGSLIIGIETAKVLSLVWKKPIIPVNHLLSHLYANFIKTDKKQRLPTLPAIGLIVSGGHTELLLIQNHHKRQLLGSTRDDAAGECFDKCARLLDLGYPGGPAIEKISQTSIINRLKNPFKLPRPMIKETNFDFSFSGLKTAVLKIVQNKLNLKEKIFLAYEIQQAITDVLVAKTINACQKYQVKSVIIGGGVAANFALRKKLKLAIGLRIPLFLPEKKYCTDNAATTCISAYYQNHPQPWYKIKPLPGLLIN